MRAVTTSLYTHNIVLYLFSIISSNLNVDYQTQNIFQICASVWYLNKDLIYFFSIVYKLQASQQYSERLINLSNFVWLMIMQRGLPESECFGGFINIIIIEMLYGQRIQQNEREAKLRKSQLYREMLDNQIRLNQQYRQAKVETNTLKHQQIHSSFQHMPVIQRRQPEELQVSFVHEIEKQQPNRSHFLPVLKDSNKFMKGVSRFVKVEQPVKQKSKQVHVYTEMIEQQDNDEYDQVCQKIIRDLQDIKNKPVKVRNRRKLYDNTEMQAHRRNRLYTDTRFPTSILDNKEVQSETKNYQSLKHPFIDIQNKGRYAPGQTKIQKTQPNQFQQSRLKINSFQLEKSNSPTEETSNNKGRLSPNLSNNANSKLDSYSPSTAQIQNKRVPAKETQDKTKEDKQNTKNMLLDRQRKNNNSVSYNQTNSELQEASKVASQNASKLELQRQTFLQVLRKVKNRGQSLYLKLAKYPNEKVIKHQ